MIELRYEWIKTWRSLRLHLAVASVLFFLVLMLVGFYTYARGETAGEAEFRYTFENQSYFNGLTFALHAFYFGFLLVLPIFVATEASAHFAGETSSGTLLLLLSRPVSRARLFVVKIVLAHGVAAVLVASLLGLGLALGLFAVGWGDLDVYPGVLQMTDRHQHLPQSTALLRFAIAWPAATIALTTPLALSLWISTLSRSPVNAVGASVALYLVMYVVAEIHFFEDLRPWLFTSSMAYWRELFQEQVDWPRLGRDAAKLAGFTSLFLALALRRFRDREERP